MRPVIARRRKIARRIRNALLVLLGALTALAALPLIAAFTGYALGSLLGCRVDESGPSACVRAGVDWGHLLYALGMSGWAMIVTLPLLGLTACLWICVGAAALATRGIRAVRKHRNSVDGG